MKILLFSAALLAATMIPLLAIASEDPTKPVSINVPYVAFNYLPIL